MVCYSDCFFFVQINLFCFIVLQKLNKIHAELSVSGSYFEASFPCSTKPESFDTSLFINIKQLIVRTNLSYKQLCKADGIDVINRNHLRNS